jgi:restriction system protein
MALWVVRCGDGANEQEPISKNIVGIGWSVLGDLKKLTEREEIQELYMKTYTTESIAQVRTNVAQIYSFRTRIQVGDYVALPLKKSASIAFGKVTGDYAYVEDAYSYLIHQRKVEWIREIPRNQIDQDLLFSFGAFLTVFQVKRNDAESRIEMMLTGKSKPKSSYESVMDTEDDTIVEENFDVEQFSRDQIRQLIAQKFAGHALANLVGEIMKAEGYTVQISPAGADGGVDVLAGSGPSGFEEPTIAVQVKSGNVVVDASTLRDLKGTMQDFGASKGLVVSWSGFTSQALKDVKKSFLTIHTWNSDDIIDHLTTVWDKLPEEIRATLRLKQIWTTLPPTD